MRLFGDRNRPYISDPTDFDTTRLRIKVWLLGASVLLLFGVLTIQLVRLQIFRQAEFEAKATVNRIRTVIQPAERGLIFDRDGNVLASNIPAFAITITPADVPNGEERSVSIMLASMFDEKPFSIETKILNGKRSIDPFLPIVLDANAESSLIFEIASMESELPGVEVEAIAKRKYENGELLAHILGYVGPITADEYYGFRNDNYRLADHIGQTGVESSYESLLRGIPGKRQVEVNASGRELRIVSETPPSPGQGLVLALNIELQKSVHEILLNSMGGSLFSTAIVLDVKTGEVLAMVSVPTYDNNLFSTTFEETKLKSILENEGRPLVNHAIADQFPPGSILKLITGSAALAEGVITPDQRIFSPGVIEIQNEVDPRITYTFRDTTSGSFNFVRGMAESSNVYFWYLAGGSPFRREIAEELLTPEEIIQQRLDKEAGIIGVGQDFLGLGADRLANWSRNFGLDTPTGIDLVGEAPGFIPDPNWKKEMFGEIWGQGDSYNFGIGQGFVAVTPLQMVVVTAAVANGGTILKPRVVREVLDADGNIKEPFRPQAVRQLDMNPEHLAEVRRGMAMAVLGGTAGNAYFPEMQIAGKTGTAEFGDERLFRDLFPTHGWFLGFAPYKEPEVAVVVFHQLGAGFLTAEIGGKILESWGKISGSVNEKDPALPQLARRDDDDFQELASQLP